MVVKGRLLAVMATVIIGVAVGVACGSDDKNEDEDTSTGGDLSFTDDVNPILTNSCGGTNCHGAAPAAGRKTYVGNETNFKADAASIKLQLTNNTMPPTAGALSTANEKILTDFLDQ
jgi:hypothetical protein